MYNGKYAKRPARKHRRGTRRISAIMVSLLLLLTLAIGGTLAYLVTNTGPVENTFTPGTVTCRVEEDPKPDKPVIFDGSVKKNVNVRNTGNVPAYLRVKLISYRVNDDGNRIGGDSSIPEFALDADWKQYGDHYYYIHPVAAGETPAAPLIGTSGIKLEDYTYTFYGATVTPEELANDPDAVPYGIKSGKAGGGKQVIEVMAEAIQANGVKADGTPAVTDAWGIAVNADGTLKLS